MIRKFLKSGFALPEVIVGMAVLVLVIVASTSLLVSIIRSNNENVNTFIAYGLAQEGLEGVRNIRDSNWLLAADIQGRIGDKAVWGEALPGTEFFGKKKYYLLDFGHLENENGPDADLNTIQNYAPWKLKDVTPLDPNTQPSPDQSRLFLLKIPQINQKEQLRYVHSSNNTQPSTFYHYLEIEPFGYENVEIIGGKKFDKVYKYRVTALVGWQESGREKKVRLTTELADWKGGPL